MMDKNCDIMLCDTMVRRYLPAMRAEMVFRLVHLKGVSQSDAARRLGVSRAAISQYLSRKRGDTGIEISRDMNELIDRWVLAVAGQEGGITLCDICRSAMKSPQGYSGFSDVKSGFSVVKPGPEVRGFILPSSSEGKEKEEQ
jgi:hypothetical protein